MFTDENEGGEPDLEDEQLLEDNMEEGGEAEREDENLPIEPLPGGKKKGGKSQRRHHKRKK